MMFTTLLNTFSVASPVGFGSGFFGVLLLPVVIWSLFWKGWALWTAAKEDSKPWFVALLVINSVGILEIIYLFIFAKRNQTKKIVSVKKKGRSK